MKEEAKYWQSQLENYKRSGISKEDFCREQGIALGQFKYQWRKKLKADRKEGLSAEFGERDKNKPPFEDVSISNNPVIDKEESETNPSIIIRFPNQLCCELKTDIGSHQFAALLKQLVLLC